jgi:heme/copper-type cytochrome/quinol oxidase subunit 2
MMNSKLLALILILAITTGCATLAPAGSKSEPVNEVYLVATYPVHGEIRVWMPSIIILEAGQETNLVLENGDDTVHGFSIDELDLREEIKPGETKTIAIKPKNPFNYKYYCHLHGIKHLGGVLVIQ